MRMIIKIIFKVLPPCLFMTTITGCTTYQKKLEGITPGMTKSHVVETLGSPKYSFRKNSIDHWIYSQYIDGQPSRKKILFSEAIVIKTGPLYKNYHRHAMAAQAQSIGEYENILSPNNTASTE